MEALQRSDLILCRHDAEIARIDVPARGRRDDVARAVAELLHGGGGAGRVIFDAAIELLEIGPGLLPAIDRIHWILVAEEIGEPHDEGAARPRIRRTRI